MTIQFAGISTAAFLLPLLYEWTFERFGSLKHVFLMISVFMSVNILGGFLLLETDENDSDFGGNKGDLDDGLDGDLDSDLKGNFQKKSENQAFFSFQMLKEPKYRGGLVKMSGGGLKMADNRQKKARNAKKNTKNDLKHPFSTQKSCFPTSLSTFQQNHLFPPTFHDVSSRLRNWLEHDGSVPSIIPGILKIRNIRGCLARSLRRNHRSFRTRDIRCDHRPRQQNKPHDFHGVRFSSGFRAWTSLLLLSGNVSTERFGFGYYLQGGFVGKTRKMVKRDKVS